MAHVRIGVYTLHGNASDVTQRAAEGMLPILHRQPGFVDYELVVANDTLISISTWWSKEHADEGAVTAARFVNDHLSSQVTLEQHYVGAVAVSSQP